MLKLIALVQSYNTNEDGATAIEYGLIAAGIALVIAGVLFSMGGNLNLKFGQVDAVLQQ